MTSKMYCLKAFLAFPFGKFSGSAQKFVIKQSCLVSGNMQQTKLKNSISQLANCLRQKTNYVINSAFICNFCVYKGLSEKMRIEFLKDLRSADLILNDRCDGQNESSFPVERQKDCNDQQQQRGIDELTKSKEISLHSKEERFSYKFP